MNGTHRAQLLLVVTVCLWLSACGDSSPPTHAPATTGGYATTRATVPDDPPPDLKYVDVTKAAGIDFHHTNGARGKKLLPETMGSGCVFFDYDGDARMDLLLLNGDRWPDDPDQGPRPSSRLYRNDGGLHFTDVTGATGLAVPFYAMGATAADADGDGDPDLFICGVGGYRYFRNDGGRFTDITADSGLDAGTWKDAKGHEHGAFATSAAFFDYDGDRRPDLFVCHYVRWSAETDIWSSMDGKTKSYALPAQYSGESCRLWRNLGAGKFEDATDKAGVRNDEGKSLGVCIVDIDDDGWMDVVVSNDTQPNYLYRNDGHGRFTDIGLRANIAYGPDARARAGMGIDSTCVGDDGRLALAIGNFSGEPVSVFEQLPGESDVFINKSDQYRVAVVTHQPLTFGLVFLDADLDGRDDLMLANGHIEPTIQQIHQEFTYAQSMQLLRNVGGRWFQEITKDVGADFCVPRVGRGLAVADLDGDGDLDVCVTSNGGDVALLRCDMPADHGFRVKLRGATPATDALGARVTVDLGSRRISRLVRCGGSYLSQSELAQTFGLGKDGTPRRVLVRWPGGKEVEYPGPFQRGRTITIDEAAGVAR